MECVWGGWVEWGALLDRQPRSPLYPVPPGEHEVLSKKFSGWLAPSQNSKWGHWRRCDHTFLSPRRLSLMVRLESARALQD